MPEAMNLIVVEDEPQVRKGLVEMVSAHCTKMRIVGQAQNGQKALELLQRLPCDILLADIAMPGMDGITLADKVKTAYPEIVTLFLTGFDSFGYAQASVKCQVFDYILKPVEPSQLAQALERAAEESLRRRTQKSRSDLMKIHLSGRMSRLYSIVMGHEIIIALKALDRQAVQQIADLVAQSIAQAAPGKMPEQRQMACWALRTLYSLYPELHSPGEEELRQRIGCCETQEEIERAIRSELLQNQEQLRREHSRNTTLNRIKHFITQHYREELCLQRLSDEFGLSTAYISELFSSLSHQNYLDFLQEVRINVAFDLLKNTNLKIYEVASRVGYQDANYFVRAFKREVGMTPKEFREKLGGRV